MGKIIKEAHEEYMILMKCNENRRHLDKPGIKKFMSTLDKSVLQDMKAQKRHKTTKKKESIDADIAFMKSMILTGKHLIQELTKSMQMLSRKSRKEPMTKLFPKETIRTAYCSMCLPAEGDKSSLVVICVPQACRSSHA
ncbi:hypothetical protein Avbf_08308 [Armadillidium vulgare]|nr:hypothetical protein Avbf_08308 [Armadillidium vulgare]